MVYRPTDRERQRYLVYAGVDPMPTFTKLFGVFGEARAGAQRIAPTVIRVTSDTVDMLRAAIALTPGSHSVRISASYTAVKTNKTQ